MVGSVTVPETAGAELFKAGSGVRDGWSLTFSDYIWSQRRLELSFLGLDLEPETAGSELFRVVHIWSQRRLKPSILDRIWSQRRLELSF